MSVKTKVPKNATIPPDATIKKILIYIIYIIFEDEDEYSIPDHHFDIKTLEGKVGKMKGVIRERVSLIIQSHVFRKRRQTSDGAVFFSCNDCETKASKYLSSMGC